MTRFYQLKYLLWVCLCLRVLNTTRQCTFFLVCAPVWGTSDRERERERGRNGEKERERGRERGGEGEREVKGEEEKGREERQRGARERAADRICDIKPVCSGWLRSQSESRIIEKR